MDSMYYPSRASAGRLLADELIGHYRYEDCLVVALNDASLQIGWPIATSIHSFLAMTVTEQIEIPGENLNFGILNQAGEFLYNPNFSTGEVEEYYSEFHGYLDNKRRETMSKINELLADGGTINPALLRERNVILVSDGLFDGAPIMAIAAYLKPYRIKRLIVCAPVASVQAVDAAHILTDEIHFLSVTDNYVNTNHYYDTNDIPSHDDSVRMIDDAVLNWS